MTRPHFSYGNMTFHGTSAKTLTKITYVVRWVARLFLYSETFPRSNFSPSGDQTSSYSWPYSVPRGKWRNSTTTLRPLLFTSITNNHSLNILPLNVISPEPELLSASVHKPLKTKRKYVPVHFPPKNIKTKTHAELQFCLLFYTGIKLGHPH